MEKLIVINYESSCVFNHLYYYSGYQYITHVQNISYYFR